MVTLQIVSDIHLEFYKKLAAVPQIEPKAPILVLAGDIGYPGTPLFWEFMSQCSRDFKHVIFVFGNHEYYNSSARLKSGKGLHMNAMEELVRGMIIHEGLTNVHVLQKSTIILEGVRFIGATLWSPISEGESMVTEMISDYKSIQQDNETVLQPEYMNRIHADHTAYILSALKEGGSEPTVVITHHLPSFDLIGDKYKGSAVNCAFASTLLDDLDENLIPKVWICGHTHSAMQKMVRGCQCILNPWGYPGENRNLTTVLYTVPT